MDDTVTLNFFLTPRFDLVLTCLFFASLFFVFFPIFIVYMLFLFVNCEFVIAWEIGTQLTRRT